MKAIAHIKVPTEEEYASWACPDEYDLYIVVDMEAAYWEAFSSVAVDPIHPNLSYDGLDQFVGSLCTPLAHPLSQEAKRAYHLRDPQSIFNCISLLRFILARPGVQNPYVVFRERMSVSCTMDGIPEPLDWSDRHS